MLVLSRKENETIEFPAIGVVIRFFGFSRKRVQVGIEAPISLKIARGEQRQPHSDNLVDSIAEYVIGEDFEQLESDLATLAELAETRDCTTTKKVAEDAINRIARLKRTVTEAIKSKDPGKEKDTGKSNSSGKPDSREPVHHAVHDNTSRCVREPVIGYVTQHSRSSCLDLSVY